MIGYEKPNAGTKFIVESAKSEIKCLTKNDFVNVWGRINDVSKNDVTHGMLITVAPQMYYFSVPQTDMT